MRKGSERKRLTGQAVGHGALLCESQSTVYEQAGALNASGSPWR